MTATRRETTLEKPSKWRANQIFLFVVLLAGIVGLLERVSLLRSVGNLMVVDDGLEPADIAIMTAETEPAGELELADLMAQHLVSRVGALIPEPSPGDRELRRRGVITDDPGRILVALGIQPEAITFIAANEGGTSDGTEALAQWCLAEKVRRVIVVTSPDHARRVRRALRRSFASGRVVVSVHTVRYDAFRASDWWQSRRTLRSGIVELQKLLLDYIQHPL